MFTNRNKENIEAGAISGAGTLTKEGNGALIFSGANNYTGGTVIKAGKLRVNTNKPYGGGIEVKEGAQLVLAADTKIRSNLTGNGILNMNGYELRMEESFDFTGTILNPGKIFVNGKEFQHQKDTGARVVKAGL